MGGYRSRRGPKNAPSGPPQRLCPLAGFGEDAFDPNLLCDRVSRAFGIAGHHHWLDAQYLEVGDRLRGVRSDDVGGGDHTRGTALKGNKDDGLSLIDKLVGYLLERPERDIEALEETRCANQHP